MRGFYGALAAIAMLATGAVPAVAKPKAGTGWTCQYSKGQIVMARALEVDPAPPRATPAAPAGSSLSGKPELVLQQTINTAGLPNRINGKDYFVASIRDNDGAIRLEAGGQPIPFADFLIDRFTPPRAIRGMFMQRPPEAFGRRLDADFADLTSGPPPYLHFIARPVSVHDTRRFYLRAPVAGFQALYTRGLGKAAAATTETLQAC